MTVFGSYARYYDLLYAGKDYAAEAEYVERLLTGTRPVASVLDLGCGTGAHGARLAAKGYQVVGVDSSAMMLARGKDRLSALPAETAARLELREGDVRSIRIGRWFDAVVSLFHVMSYQTGQQDLRAAFATAREHLQAGGVFLFDFWYGPAVLAQMPEHRTLRLSDDAIEVVRVADPVMHPNENVVDVNYRVEIRDRATETVDELLETHRMRYLFLPEVGDFLEHSGFGSWTAEEWMTGRTPGFDTWSVCVTAVAA